MKRPSRLIAGLSSLSAVLAAIAAGVINTADAEPGTPQLSSFQLPSGNIACQIYEQTVRCEVREPSYRKPAEPIGGCENSAFGGNNITMSVDQPPHFSCASDTVLDEKLRVLAYGSTTTVGRISCTSTTAHVRCAIDNGKASFQLARERYQLDGVR